MDHNHSHDHESVNIIKLSTVGIIKEFLAKRKAFKNKKEVASESFLPTPPSSTINHIAIILDGEVQEIMRAQNRLTALLLSDPKFVVFDVDDVRPEIGWKYHDGKFHSGV